MYIYSFYQRLEPHYSQTFSTELENAHILLDEWRSDPSPNRPIRINTAEVTGGHVALLVSELFDTNSNRQVSALVAMVTLIDSTNH